MFSVIFKNYSASSLAKYGLNDIYIGAPAVINRQGIQKVIEIPLSDSEQDRMAASAKQLKEILDEASCHIDNSLSKSLGWNGLMIA